MMQTPYDCTSTNYAAIRQNTESGRWFIDLTSMAFEPHMVRSAFEATDKQIPRYAQENPVVGIAKVKTIVEEFDGI